MAEPASLTDEQLRAVIARAGFTGVGAEQAFAIAKAESGARSQVIRNRPDTGDLSYGLFQINMLGPLGPARRKRWGLSSNDQLLDPLVNARAAYEISKGGTDWNGWANTLARTGLPRKPYGTTAAAGVGAAAAGSQAAGWRWPWQGAVDAGRSFEGFLKIVTSGDWWLRFAEMVGGALIIVLALAWLAKGTAINAVAGSALKAVRGKVAAA